MKEKIRIAIVKESLCLGGTERSTSNISQALAKDNEVYMILFDGADIKYPYGGTMLSLSAPPRTTFIGKVINSFIRSFRLRKILKKYKIQVLFSFTSVSGMLMHERFSSCKKIISCRDFKRLKNETKSFYDAVTKADAIVFNSKYQRDFFQHRYPNLSEKLFVSYNIIDTNFIKQQSHEPLEEEFHRFISGHTKNIISVGRFCSEKGFEYLISSFKLVRDKIPTSGLVLVGDGILKDKYVTLVDKYDLKKDIYFAGFQSNPYKYMKKCDLYVLSSVSEGFPNVVLEAMACSLPVISTNCLTGPSEILNDIPDYSLASKHFEILDYGILTPRFGVDSLQNQFAIEELSKAICQVIENDVLYNNLIEKSQKRVSMFSQSNAVNELNHVIKYVLKA